MKPALIIIDMQRWFFTQLQRQAVLTSLVAHINELIDLFHTEGLPVVHVLTQHQADGSTGDLWMRRNKRVCLIEGTTDAEELPEIHRANNDIFVIKTRHSAFIRTNLENILRSQSVDTLMIAGFSTNACVGLTAIEAYERDFDVLLAGDAILGCDQPRADVMLGYLQTEFDFRPITNASIIQKITATCSRAVATRGL